MSEEQNAIQKLYEDPKAKGFVNHLIGAYLPIHKPQKVWEFDKGQKAKCNVCGKELMSLGEALGRIWNASEEFKTDTIDHFRKSLKGQDISPEEHPMYKHVSKGRILAWTGEKTDTFLCMECIKDLLDLVQTGLLMGDKNLSWRINKIQREGVFNVFHESSNLNPEEKEMVKDIEKRVERSQKKKVATFGDLEVLQKLKKKMETEDGKEKK